jgi:hypothetical protein
MRLKYLVHVEDMSFIKTNIKYMIVAIIVIGITTTIAAMIAYNLVPTHDCIEHIEDTICSDGSREVAREVTNS